MAKLPELDPARILGEMVIIGLRVTWEYPGLAFIRISDTLTVSTGLNGWDYGTISRLEDDAWQPVEDDVATPAGLTTRTTDPATIANAWAQWVASQNA